MGCNLKAFNIYSNEITNELILFKENTLKGIKYYVYVTDEQTLGLREQKKKTVKAEARRRSICI
jgi:hypothetical protein